MRCLTYNILDGGLGRADPLAEVVAAQSADVIGLVEAERPEVVARIADRLGMDVVHAPGRSRAVALLSRWPVLESVNVGQLRGESDSGPRAWLEVVVETPGGEALPVTLVHLSPHRPAHAEARRLRELEPVLEEIAAYRSAGRPHVLMGDFNSVSPTQEIDESRLRPSDLHGLRENENALPRDVVQAVLDAGYVDTFEACEPDAARSAGTLDTIRAGLRVDYVFTFGLEASGAWIETDRLARYASDHFPAGAEVADG